MNLTALGFIAVFGLLLVLAFSRHPIYGLLAYLWVFYNHPPSRWWGSALPDVRWSLIAAIITFVAVLRLPRTPNAPPWHGNWGARLLLLFTGWIWLQYFWAVSKPLHLEGCILYSKYLLLFYIIYRVIDDEKHLDLFFWGHVIGCFIFSWVAYQSAGGGRFEHVGGPGVDDANTLGMHLTTGLAFAGFMLLGLQGKRRWLALAAIPFILNGIILTASRGSMLGMVAAGVVAVYFSARKQRRLVIGSVLLAGVLLFMLTNDLFWQRWESIWHKDQATGKYEASAESRIDIIKYGWKIARDHPLGAGHRGHALLSPYYFPEKLLSKKNGTKAAHNTFMAVLVEQGFPGAVLFFFLFIWMILTFLQLKYWGRKIPESHIGYYTAAVASAFMAYFIAGQFSNFMKAEVGIWLIALTAVLKGFPRTVMVEQISKSMSGNNLLPAKCVGQISASGSE